MEPDEVIAELRNATVGMAILNSREARDVDGTARYWFEFDRHPRFERLSKYFSEIPRFQKFDENHVHGIASIGAPFTRMDLFRWVVRRAVETDPEGAMADVFRYLKNEKVRAYRIVLVEGLYCGSSDENASFANDIKIVHRMHAPVRAIRDNWIQSAELFGVSDYLVCQEFSVNRHIRDAAAWPNRHTADDFPVIEHLEDRIALLSLISRRGLQIAASAVIQADEVPRANDNITYALHSRRTPVYLDSPIIGFDPQRAELRYKKFAALNTKWRKKLRIPMAKLNDCLSETGVVQRAIDLRTCLEALFLDGSKEGEYRYRLSLRAAFYAAEEILDRREIFEAVKRWYDLGSEAVHSGSLNLKDGDYQKFEIVTGAVRTALLKRIDGETPDYDNLIIGNGLPNALD
ncbi:MAG: hypothetical protein C0606_15015 [Hyphomicrobiales bacterium]|nr:MAG: hypothetical protein C0606_15015 [Hyphomicrobiales bacterium]